MHLVEEAVDGCWIGHRARTAELRNSGIGSVYSPPEEGGEPSWREHVETIVDVGYREGVRPFLPNRLKSPPDMKSHQGWLLKCEKGGIRRILMNLFGNSLKFTTVGFLILSIESSTKTRPGWIRPSIPPAAAP